MKKLTREVRHFCKFGDFYFATIGYFRCKVLQHTKHDTFCEFFIRKTFLQKKQTNEQNCNCFNKQTPQNITLYNLQKIYAILAAKNFVTTKC